MSVVKLIGKPPNPSHFYLMNQFYSHLYANINSNIKYKYDLDVKTIVDCCHHKLYRILSDADQKCLNMN